VDSILSNVVRFSHSPQEALFIECCPGGVPPQLQGAVFKVTLHHVIPVDAQGALIEDQAIVSAMVGGFISDLVANGADRDCISYDGESRRLVFKTMPITRPTKLNFPLHVGVQQQTVEYM
jgi:hypothetical protein